MTTLDRLLDYLPSVYDTSPAPVLALRLTYQSGQMRWSVADDILTTTIAPGGPGTSLSVDLSQYTVATLANYLGSQPGYSVLYLDQTGSSSLSALALVPESGDIATSNGDHIHVATNPTWTHLAAIAAELELAAAAIVLMPLEMQTTTASDSWLDLLGSYYAVPRQLGEQDEQYAPRIPAEVILPRLNNMGIAGALEATTGQVASCTDAPVFGRPEPAFDGRIAFSGAPHFYNATATLILNLFDVSVGYDLLGGLSPSDFTVLIRRQIDRLRAAGTHLRNLTLTASVMGDIFAGPADALVETVFIEGIAGTGQSFDSASGAGFVPTSLLPLSFSQNVAMAATLTTGVRLAGTGQSFDRLALPLAGGTGSNADSATANLSTSTFAALVGTAGSIGSAFGALGSAVIFNAVSASADSAVATLQIGPQLGFGSSSDHGSAALTTVIRLIGTGAATDSGTGAISTAIRLPGTGASADSGTGPASTAIRLTGTGAGSNSASLQGGGGFSVDFSSAFQH